MQAQGLHHAAAVGLKVPGHGLEGIRGKELAVPLQLGHGVQAGLRLVAGNAVPVLFQNQGDQLLPGFFLIERDDVIGGGVHHMDGAGAGIQDNVVAAQFVLMYHRRESFPRVMWVREKKENPLFLGR